MEAFMRFFGRQGWGRSLLLITAVVVVGAVCVSNGDKPSNLVGQWIFADGYRNSKVPEKSVELFSNGTGVVDGISVTWKVENKRLMILTSSIGIVTDYKVSGYELVFTYDNEESATFVKKEMLEEYKKKKEEEKKKEVEERIEKVSGYFTDSRNGQKYRIVNINGKTWMAQNLNYQTGNSWCYENNNSNCEKYGRLYDWNTAKTACPAGWHLPSRNERNYLEKETGGNMALKSIYGWDGNNNGTDAFGFSTLPGGCRGTDGSFNGVGKSDTWWTATEDGGDIAWGQVWGCGGFVAQGLVDKDFGLSVRCVADN
jgi:uncharacterized protein (TIGR02145 family)